LNFQSKDQPSLWWVTLRVGLVYPGRIPSATSACGYKPKFRGVVQRFRFTPNSRRLSANVGFGPDFVCLTLNSRRAGQGSGTSACDPKATFEVFYQPAVAPPSMASAVPVTKPAWSEAR
jgi:hypothetical protein